MTSGRSLATMVRRSTLNMKSSWYYLVEELRRAQQCERTQSIQKRHDLQEVQRHLDWLPWQRLDKQSNTKVRTALQTWHRAIFTKMAEGQEGKHLQCPHCGCAADAIHLLWQCKETNRHFPPLPSEVATELEQGINREFWAQGLVQRPPYQISTGGAAIQAWGSWTGLDEITLQPHDAITLLHHTLFGGEMYRMGAISTVLPGKQSVARAWYYGLRMIARYVDLQSMVRVHVLSVKAWQGWVKGRHHETFHDLAELVTWDQRQRIRALSVTQQQINTMPSTGLSLRNRFKDANRAAKEFALSKQPVAIEQELQEQDQRYGQICTLGSSPHPLPPGDPGSLHARAEGHRQRTTTESEGSEETSLP